jgi:outer membrane protein assembly factor BamE
MLATGCQSLQSSDNLLGRITPYRLEIVQGNVITKSRPRWSSPA